MVTNIKKIALSLLVACLAIGFSAFTNVEKVVDPEWVYVQTGSDEYTRIEYSSYNAAKCQDNSVLECSFIQPESDKQNHNTPLTHMQVSSLGFAASTTNGLYVP